MDINPPTRRRARAIARVVPGACAALALALASQASAQGPSAEDIASARVLGTEGVRLAEAGDCAAAIAKLDAAEKLYHAPTTLERLGECQVKTGRIVAGTETLNRVVRETLPPNAPGAFVAAQQRAEQALAAALPRIAKLRIHVDGPAPEQVAVTVDGTGVPAALFDSDRPSDPGPHEVRASAAGYRSATANVKLVEGASSAVDLKLEPEANGGAAGAPVGAAAGSLPPGPAEIAEGPSRAPGAEPARGSGPNRVPAFVAYGVGGVGLAVGAVFGVLALGTKSSLDNACPNRVCPTQASRADIDALSTRANVANVGFGVAILGGVVGTVLLLT
ncbi:MAG: hypothetical protein JOZ69_24825, partial [Myxococcales bacterium]|nr:hypothetical protein [Myxococcales bacterium]